MAKYKCIDPGPGNPISYGKIYDGEEVGNGWVKVFKDDNLLISTYYATRFEEVSESEEGEDMYLVLNTEEWTFEQHATLKAAKEEAVMYPSVVYKKIGCTELTLKMSEGN